MSADRWSRVESLCHAALARPAAERAAFVAEACGADESLRAEVASLVARAESAPYFLDVSVSGESPGSLIGRQLGAYRIEAAIGAGGMGEVYRATDTRLGRDVAVKVLPAAFAADPHRRMRFEREARAVAALKHPNICTIHDVGHDQDIEFLVMELVEGESLAARLARGPLPLDEALARATEIADALDTAHRHGIVHRDLKPGNVMLARNASGDASATHVKLLDFGLARMVPSGGSVSQPTSEEKAEPTTQAGAMLGTLQYMAPEQIEGRPADARTDIFAFGALLYEMLTGRRAFDGASTAALMAAILREDPPPVHPREVGRVVCRCLAKDPLGRYQSARDLLNDLEEVRQALNASESEFNNRSAIEAVPRVRGRYMRWLSIAAIGGAIATTGYLLRPRALTLPSYEPLTFQRGVVTGARFSPDGQIYYSAAWGTDPPRVYVTRLGSAASVPIPDLPPATLLSVSSKGELALLLTEGREAQQSSGTLARASVLGGPPRPLLDGVLDADWARDGERLAVLRDNYDLELMTPAQTPSTRVLVSRAAFWPRMSPRGDRIAYMGDEGVGVIDLEGRNVLTSSFPWAFSLAWRPDGREIWFAGETTGGSGADRVLYAVSLSGQQRLLATAPGAMTIQDIAADGKKALVTTGAGWLGIQAGGKDRTSESTLDLSGRSDLVGLSSDGTQALVSEGRAVARGLYLRATDGSRTIPLSADRAVTAIGLSPDGRWVLTRRDDDPAHLLLIPTGAGEPRQLDLDRKLRPRGRAHWSRDGRYIFMTFFATSEYAETYPRSRRIYRLGPSTDWQPVTPAGIADAFAVSPDGRAIAAPDRAGDLTLYPVDGGELRTFAGERGIPIAWTSDGWLYLATRDEASTGRLRPAIGARIYRRHLTTGRVESWLEISPPDPAGVTSMGDLFLSDDGVAYAYSYKRLLNVLYLVDGLR